MTDIKKAIELLNKKGATLAAVSGCETYVSHKRGVSPILDKIDGEPDFFEGACVADKVIGKAAAMLLAGHGVKAIHAVIISRKACDYLQDKPVSVSFETKVPFIVNRSGTGMCPMEQVTAELDDAAAAETKIRRRLAELAGGK